MVFNSDFHSSNDQEISENPLLHYLQHQHPDVLAHIAQSASPEIKEIISRNVQGLVGVLPSDDFDVQITTNRDNLAGLLASAMMTGYFLRQMEQCMHLEENISRTASSRSQSTKPERD
ncbi:MAG: DUF760 domain-containing protein [Limnospira sp. PMC 737.11]|uniref:DUF760 domain-containing protein n=1 Tax=Limnospira fusiformis PMC 851.14 TaxID=2219512 RepID=A0ABU9EGJ7_LIMFS|nr:DUF760 domain-containing protein [Limnospira sp. PMC 737.11]MDT9277041.1 DUF760 domain-containing protein [Limnospira sp. PMC 737.11]